MEKKILFMVVKDGDNIGYEAFKEFEAKDGLNVLGAAVEFAMAVAQEMVGLTMEEAELNIYRAVDKTLKRLEENK